MLATSLPRYLSRVANATATSLIVIMGRYIALSNDLLLHEPCRRWAYLGDHNICGMLCLSYVLLDVVEYTFFNFQDLEPLRLGRGHGLSLRMLQGKMSISRWYTSWTHVSVRNQPRTSTSCPVRTGLGERLGHPWFRQSYGAARGYKYNCYFDCKVTAVCAVRKRLR